MAHAGHLFNAYYNHYRGQSGGNYPPFRGMVYQHGEGLGSILRGALRFLAPIASTVATTFIKDTNEGLRKGSNIIEAARSAILPSLKAGIKRTVRRITTGKGRSVKGKRRRRKKMKMLVAKKARSKNPLLGGRKRKRKAYKKGKKAKKHKISQFSNF